MFIIKSFSILSRRKIRIFLSQSIQFLCRQINTKFILFISDKNEYEFEDILTPVSNINEAFSFGELNQESPISIMSSECFFQSPIKSLNQAGSSNEYEIEDLYYTQVSGDRG